MKRSVIIILLAIVSLNLEAQRISPLNPILAVWNKGGENISLKNAKYGVQSKDSLSLNIYFNKVLLESNNKYSNLNLEFRWYYYLSTRKSLMYIEKIPFKKSIKKNNQIIYKSTMHSLQPGWWEVVVVNSNDGGFLQFGNTYKFQVFIK